MPSGRVRVSSTDEDYAYYQDYFRQGSDMWERNLCRASERNARLRFGGEMIHWSVYRYFRRLPCVRCGVSPANGVDHIVPRVAGGQHVVTNLQPMCRPCNSGKATEDRRRAKVAS